MFRLPTPFASRKEDPLWQSLLIALFFALVMFLVEYQSLTEPKP
jgi:hypothetical protein